MTPTDPMPVVESRTGPGFGPPIHPAAAVLLLGVDNMWNLAEWTVVSWILTIPASFVTVAVPTFWIQRKFRRNSIGKALFFAGVLGVIAAVPTSLTGTPVGLAFLAWTGVSRWLGWPSKNG